MPAPFKTVSTKLSNRQRKIMSFGYYVPRQRAENEALPPQQSVYSRPVWDGKVNDPRRVSL